MLIVLVSKVMRINIVRPEELCGKTFLICLSILSLSLASCSTEENDNEINIGTEELDVAVEKLTDYIATSNPSIEDMKKYASQLGNVDGFELNENILTIKFKDGNIINYDYDGLMLPPDNDYDFDNSSIEAMMDSLAAVYPELSFEDDTVEVTANAPSYNSKPLTRATATKDSKVALRRHNILIWNPWEETGDIATTCGYNSLVNMIRAINKEVSSKIKFRGKLFKSSAISDIKTFGEYDIVFVLCHGHNNGRLILPKPKFDELYELFPSIKKQMQEINLTRRKKGEKPVMSLSLPKTYLDELLPDLSHTVVFTVMCDAARDLSVMWLSCKAKKVADFFGATGRCNMKTMAPEYASVLYNMSILKSTKDAFVKHINRYTWDEKISKDSTRTNEYEVVRKGGERTVGFVMGKIPRVTKVNRKAKTRSTTGETSEYQINVNLYGPTGMLDDFHENMFGVIVKNMASQQETLIPLSSSEIDSYSFIDWGDVTVADIVLKPRALEDNSRYACSLYLVDENNVPQTFSNIFIINTESGYSGLCPDDNHPHAIDLGLPSGTKWSCCNVGASKPEDLGGRYAWGETSEKESYTWENYIFFDGYYRSDRPRFNLPMDKIAGTSYDAAHVLMGKKWQMPAVEQVDELITQCEEKYIQYNGVDGCLFIGQNNNSIFLPYTGFDLYGRPDGSYMLSESYEYLYINKFAYIKDLFNGVACGSHIRPLWQE